MQALLLKSLSREFLPLLVAAGALFAFALGQLGGLSPILDLFAQISAHWLVITIAAVWASFATRYAYVILASSLMVAVLLPSVLTSRYVNDTSMNAFSQMMSAMASSDAQTAPEASINPRRFKVLGFNTYNLNLDHDAVWREIERHNADVVMLIEFGPNKGPLMRKMLKHYPHHASCQLRWDCAMALFSRLPLRNPKIVSSFDDAGPPHISAEAEVGNRHVTIIGAHILSPNHGPRANFIELDHLAKVVRRQSMPVVVVGDLNTTIWANSFDNFRRRSGLNHMGHLIPTWPVKPLPLPQFGIDHVFASPELRIAKVRAGHAAGSDHIPLVASIELR